MTPAKSTRASRTAPARPKSRAAAARKKKSLPPAAPAREKYLLKLYVTGSTGNSIRAIENIRTICEQYLKGRYDLEIIDVYQYPTLAKGEQIIAAPTLIKSLPLPLRRLIGNMADKEKVLLGLDVRPDSVAQNRTK